MTACPCGCPATGGTTGWNPANADAGSVMGLLEAPAAVRLRARPVGSRVNSARNDGPELVEVVSGEAQPQLL